MDSLALKDFMPGTCRVEVHTVDPCKGLPFCLVSCPRTRMVIWSTCLVNKPPSYPSHNERYIILFHADPLQETSDWDPYFGGYSRYPVMKPPKLERGCNDSGPSLNSCAADRFPTVSERILSENEGSLLGWALEYHTLILFS